MKRLLMAFCMACTVLALPAQEAGQGIRFLEGEKWERVLDMAVKENKCIFMDCYTSWCGPCKALAKDVFTRQDVGDFFNAHFINVKYDMEKGEGKALRKKYQKHIIGYPTLLLLDSKGEVLHQMAGFQQAEALIAGMKAGMEGESLFAYRKRYEQGERDLAFLKKYMGALEGAFLKEDMEKVVREYMDALPLDSLKNREIWDFVWKYIKDPYSPQFAYVMDHLTYYGYRMKVDMYALESQLVFAFGRAVRECIAPLRDEKGNFVGMTDEPEKVKVLWELLSKADLKQRAEFRMKLRIHELQLKEDWENVYRYLTVGRDAGVLGYAESYVDEVIRYMAVRCTDLQLLRQALTLMEGLQEEADRENRKVKSAYYKTLALLHERLGNASQAKEFRKKEAEREAMLQKEFENMMKG